MLREWLRKTYKIEKSYQKVRPRIVCKDGFSMSVQAGIGIYSVPRKNLENGEYKAVEVGFPSEPEELIFEYAECEDYTQTVYGYVPVELVEKVIEKHGGMED